MKFEIDLNECSLDELKLLIKIKERQYDSAKKTRGVPSGVVFSDYKPKRKYIKSGKYVKKGSRTGKKWGSDELRDVQVLFQKGMPRKQIAKKVKRSINSIHNAIWKIKNG